MLYITTDDDGTVIGACDGPEIDMQAKAAEWAAEHIDAENGLKPTLANALGQWYRKRDEILEKLYEKYGSIAQHGFPGLWAKVLVKDFKYVARPFKRSL